MAQNSSNIEVMKNIHYKLYRQFDKKINIAEWFSEKDQLGGNLGEALTLGTDDNLETIEKASIVPVVPLAIGLGAAVIGLITIPMGPGPGLTEAEKQFFTQVRATGENLSAFGCEAMLTALKLSLIPAGVAAISIPKRIFRVIAQKVDDKIDPVIVKDDRILTLIEDLIENKKDDSTLNFPLNFLKKVNLKDNSQNFNLELLGKFADYRSCLQEAQKGNITNQEVQEAFQEIIDFLNQSKHRLGVSKSFRDNVYVNLLIEEYGTKKEDSHVSRNR